MAGYGGSERHERKYSAAQAPYEKLALVVHMQCFGGNYYLCEHEYFDPKSVDDGYIGDAEKEDGCKR